MVLRVPSAWAAAISSSILAAPSAGASVAGISVAGISVAGISVAGISVAGTSVAAGACVAPPPQAASRAANTNNDKKLNISFLVFILFSPLELGCERHALASSQYYITGFV